MQVAFFSVAWVYLRTPPSHITKNVRLTGKGWESQFKPGPIWDHLPTINLNLR